MFNDANLLFKTSAGTETAAPDVTQTASVSLSLKPAKISISPNNILGETPATFCPDSFKICTDPFWRIKQLLGGSPFLYKFNDAQKDLINPAVEGTKNVLDSVNRIKTVKKVIITY